MVLTCQGMFTTSSVHSCGRTLWSSFQAFTSALPTLLIKREILLQHLRERMRQLTFSTHLHLPEAILLSLTHLPLMSLGEENIYLDLQTSIIRDGIESQSLCLEGICGETKIRVTVNNYSCL